jgi:hypothetical protein
MPDSNHIKFTISVGAILQAVAIVLIIGVGKIIFDQEKTLVALQVEIAHIDTTLGSLQSSLERHIEVAHSAELGGEDK